MGIYYQDPQPQQLVRNVRIPAPAALAVIATASLAPALVAVAISWLPPPPQPQRTNPTWPPPSTLLVFSAPNPKSINNWWIPPDPQPQRLNPVRPIPAQAANPPQMQPSQVPGYINAWPQPIWGTQTRTPFTNVSPFTPGTNFDLLYAIVVQPALDWRTQTLPNQIWQPSIPIPWAQFPNANPDALAWPQPSWGAQQAGISAWNIHFPTPWSPVRVDLLTAWPQPTWGTQQLVTNAWQPAAASMPPGFFVPGSYTAWFPDYIPVQKQVQDAGWNVSGLFTPWRPIQPVPPLWDQPTWGAQSATQFAWQPTQPVPNLQQPPHVEQANLAWQVSWNTQLVTKITPQIFTWITRPPNQSPIAQWSQPTWGAQGSPISGLFLPPTFIPTALNYGSPIQQWAQPDWPAQTGRPVAGEIGVRASFVSPKQPPSQIWSAWFTIDPPRPVQLVESFTYMPPPGPVTRGGFTVYYGGRVILPPKKVGETVDAPADFISRLGGTEVISSCSCAASVYTGVDPNPSAILVGAASFSGTIVTQVVTGGILGTIYELLFTVNTSLNQRLELAAYLAVIPDLV